MKSKSRVMRLIALFKLLKALSLIVVGVLNLKLMHSDIADKLAHWVVRLGFDPGKRWIDHALQRAANVSPDKIRDLGLGSLVYAGLFLTEGIGLWLQKRWAEWFTVIITSSLVPLEVYELCKHPTVTKVLVMIVNLAVVGYLVWRIRQEAGSSE